MKTLTPNSFKKPRSEKITYFLVNPIVRKLVTWAMRLQRLTFFFWKTGVKKVFTHTAKSTATSSNFLVWEFCGKAQFPHSFGRIAQICSNFQQNFPTRKLGTIPVFYEVFANKTYQICSCMVYSATTQCSKNEDRFLWFRSLSLNPL